VLYLCTRFWGSLACAVLEFLDDWVSRVELQRALAGHIGRHAGVPKGLSLHDTFHIGAPSELTRNKDARGIGDTVGEDDLLNGISKNFLDLFAQVLELFLLLFSCFLLLLGFLKFQTLFGDVDKFLAIEFLQLSRHVLVDRVGHEDNLKV